MRFHKKIYKIFRFRFMLSLCTSFVKSVMTVLFLFVALSLATGVQAQFFSGTVQQNLSISAGVGIKTEDFRWSIAGNSDGKNPNVLSEIIFNPIKSKGFYLNSTYKFAKKLSVAIAYNTFQIYKGRATDFDYAGDNRTDATSQLFLNSNKGHMRALNIGLFYHLLDDSTFGIKAGANYSTAKELLYLLNDDDPTLQTTYSTKWHGPGLSVDGSWTSAWKFFVAGSISYSFLKYAAEANWNNIPTFLHPVSFTHAATGHGWNTETFAGYKLNTHLNAIVKWQYDNWKTGYGKDKLYLTNGDVPETRMNAAIRKANSWQLEATYAF